MSFDKAIAYVSCDKCGLESEPAELTRSAKGSYSIADAVKDVEADGWQYDPETENLTCPDCLADEDEEA